MKHLSIMCALAFCLASCASAPGNPEDAASVAAWESRVVGESGVTGLAYGIIEDGRLESSGYFGFADRERGRAVDADTIFQIASVSKTITGLAALILAQDGTISLDENVSRYLPFKVTVPLHPGSIVTMRQLLSHTSGIRDNEAVYEGSYTIASGGGDSPTSLEDFLRSYLVAGGALYDAEANFTGAAPGIGGEYSNVGFGLVGLVVERASGASFADFCKERIFKPCGMGSSAWFLRDAARDRLALPYDGEGRALPPYSFPTYPDGALRTTIGDYARFIEALMREPGSEGSLISDVEIYADMLRPQAGDGLQALVWHYQPLQEIMLETRFSDTVGHTGGDPGVVSLCAWNPRTKDGIIVFINQSLTVSFKSLRLLDLVKLLLSRTEL